MSEPPKVENKSSQPESAPREVAKPQAEQQVIIPPEAVKAAAERGESLEVTIASAHSGPLPSPAMLRAYNEVVPGLPAIIISEFQKESAHRRLMQKCGQFGAISIAGASILAGAILGYVLQSPLAALAVIGPVCGVVGTAQLLDFWIKAK